MPLSEVTVNIKSAHFLPGTNKRLGDKYILLECLGDGSHGWVWRAERLADGMKRAWESTKREPVTAKEVAWSVVPVALQPADTIKKIKEKGRKPISEQDSEKINLFEGGNVWFDKKGIVEFAQTLIHLGIKIISTGGTAQELIKNKK